MKPEKDIDPAEMVRRLPAPVEAGVVTDAFKNADDEDWRKLFEMLPDSGHGRFWKSVLRSAKAALCTTEQPAAVGGWDSRYRPLAEGETIREGDECLTDSHLGWQPANCIGQPAPDPNYIAHRMYRRLATPASAEAELRAEVETGIEEEQRLRSRLGIETRARESAEAEVERLTKERDAARRMFDGIRGKGVSMMCADALDAQLAAEARAEALQARLDTALEALEPFAKLAGAVFFVDEDGREMNASRADNDTLWGFDRTELTYGDFRRARQIREDGDAQR